MAEQSEKATTFKELHKKGDPIIIYNAWDAGSAKAIKDAGAKAIATGDHPVGFAHGFTDEDFDDFTFDTYLQTIKEIAKRVEDVPFSVDISNASGLDDMALAERIKTLIDVGVVGINFEDRSDMGGLVEAEEHARRIKVISSAAKEKGINLFINARSDIFAVNELGHEEYLDEALSRAKAYRDAGASGFFVPGLMDVDLISELTNRSPLPVNIIRLPGAPSTKELVEAGVSRISYGPVVQMEMIEWLKDKARKALAGEI